MTGGQWREPGGVEIDCPCSNREPHRRPALTPFHRRTLVSVLLVALPTVVLGGAWRLGGVSALEDDLIYYLPVRQYIGERIAAGEFPLWNPLTLMGTSIAADPQSGLWYPPTYLFVILPPLVAYPVTIILHFALAGGGMYRFLRASRRDWRAALLGAVAFEFCGYLIAHRAHLTIHHAVAWLPWIFYGWRRFADAGRYRHFALASAALGVQMLVQHIQVSIITAVLLTGYVAAVLWPLRRSLWWQYPLGIFVGAMLAAVQLLPTGFHFAASGRGPASYSLFIENSWVPTSALTLLFPMLFGSRTPNFWGRPWWGMSHFCEQWAYGSILVLVLAGASLSLLRRRKGTGTLLAARERFQFLDAGASRETDKKVPLPFFPEVFFWWAASLIALVLALGEFTPRFMPVSKWLFHLPFYRNLRVPARWILVWSVAMPVLASAVVSVMLSGGGAARRAARWVRLMATRTLPLAAVACILVMVIARWQVGALESAYGDRYGAETVLAGLRSAVRLSNRAIWWPIVLMIVTAWLLLRWSHSDRSRTLPLLFCLLLIDLTSVAAFVDVDVHTYRRADIQTPPPLAGAIRRLESRPGHRLLVPRLQADYDRPLEVLWPQTNPMHGIATFNGYGPFWPLANRLLFRFMPWGASEAMLELLENPRLMKAMGVRFVAVRTEQERELLRAATRLPRVDQGIEPIAGSERMTPVRYGRDIHWPVRIDEPGLYELAFDAEPVPGSPSRWFVRLETPAGEPIGWTRTLAPVDLSMGRRRMRFLFRCDRSIGPAYARVKAEMGWALSVGQAAFGRVAAAAQPGGTDPALVRRADLPGGVSLYELPGAVELVRWAERVEPATDLPDAIEKLLAQPMAIGLPGAAVVEWPDQHAPLPRAGDGTVACRRPAGHDLRIEANSTTGGLLVFNESYDPGWSATTDGGQVDILRVNAVCQGVVVPPGPHQVRFVYCPRGLGAGAAASVAALAILAAGFFLTTRRRPMISMTPTR